MTSAVGTSCRPTRCLGRRVPLPRLSLRHRGRLSTETLERPSVPPPVSPGAGLRTSVIVRGALSRWGLRGTALLYLGLMIALPTVAVITRGFQDGLQSLRDALNAPGAREAIVLTLVLAAVPAIIKVILGTLIAYVLVRYEFPGRAWLSTIVDIPFAIPTLVTGVMLRALYGPNSLIGGFLGGHG